MSRSKISTSSWLPVILAGITIAISACAPADRQPGEAWTEPAEPAFESLPTPDYGTLGKFDVCGGFLYVAANSYEDLEMVFVPAEGTNPDECE